MRIEIYADETGQYTEDQINLCNVAEIEVPEELVREWYEANEECAEECIQEGFTPSFDTWIKEVYTCDSFDGFYDFVVNKGFMPTCGTENNGWVWFMEDEKK